MVTVLPFVPAQPIELRPSTFSGDAVIALLALAMGVRNATVRRFGVPDLTTTAALALLVALAYVPVARRQA